MDVVLAGLLDAFNPTTIAFIVIGVAIGNLFGAIPGLNSLIAIAIAVPITYYLSPLAAIAMLMGMDKGGKFGGSVSAILINTPGSPEAAATVFDGYPLARQGKALKALKMALYASVFGETLSGIILVAVAAPLAAVAIMLGPPELTAVIVLAFALISSLVGESPFKGLIMIGLGVFVGTIGNDPVTAEPRLTFGWSALTDGIPFVAMAVGLLALSEIIIQLETRGETASALAGLRGSTRREDRRVSWREFWACRRTLLRSSLIGAACGAAPGIGASVTPFIAYGAAKRASDQPETFGTGRLEGVAAAESADSAVAGANLVPLITLGIPGSATAALMVGAFIIHGVVPGPLMFQQHAQLIYGLFGAVFIGTAINFVIGQFGMRLFAAAVSVPRSVLFPIVALLILAGTYLAARSLFAVGVVIAFGIFGYVIRKLDFPYVNFVIGFILGKELETNLRATLILSDNNPLILIERPIASALLVVAGLIFWRFGFARRRRPAAT
ncbi:MAG: Tricarboxylate transporter family protein [Alphaproteobacteria bacterium]|nr:Tricarboxylate transporter family protein [Alphaproteobacteria bacterium]